MNGVMTGAEPRVLVSRQVEVLGLRDLLADVLAIDAVRSRLIAAAVDVGRLERAVAGPLAERLHAQSAHLLAVYRHHPRFHDRPEPYVDRAPLEGGDVMVLARGRVLVDPDAFTVYPDVAEGMELFRTPSSVAGGAGRVVCHARSSARRSRRPRDVPMTLSCKERHHDRDLLRRL